MPGEIPLIGEKFPEMTVVTDFGIYKLPDQFKGKWFVLFSHPADFTPVCTTEFYAFAKRYEDFKKLNTELIGLSVDSNYSHMKWKEWIEEKLGMKIPFPIIADPQGVVAKKLGLIHAESSTHTVRAVFVVDDKGIIRTILYYPLELGRLIDEILRIVLALQVGDKYGRAMPANWPHNELIGDKLIVPPPATWDEAKKRMEEYNCFDWWFCYDDNATEEEKKLAEAFLKRAAEKPSQTKA
ncbi:MAG: peroxiredoxin [Desulfurococcales archaeon]|nr:peroxiredoxin [Desulfurococcales archaeon]